MPHTFNFSDVAVDFCSCIEQSVVGIVNDIISETTQSLVEQNGVERLLRAAPVVRLPIETLLSGVDDLLELEEGLINTILRGLPVDAQTPVAIVLSCLADQINGFLADLLSEFDPFGIIKQYSDLEFSTRPGSFLNGFNSNLQVFSDICGGNGAGFQAQVNNALLGANYNTSGVLQLPQVTAAVQSPNLTAPYRTAFDSAVACVCRVQTMANNPKQLLLGETGLQALGII